MGFGEDTPMLGGAVAESPMVSAAGLSMASAELRTHGVGGAIHGVGGAARDRTSHRSVVGGARVVVPPPSHLHLDWSVEFASGAEARRHRPPPLR